jgi:hypothetical protein
MHNMNSSGMVMALTPVIFAPVLEKLLRMQGRSMWRSGSWIVAGEFHSTRKFFRRSPRIRAFRRCPLPVYVQTPENHLKAGWDNASVFISRADPGDRRWKPANQAQS